MTENLIDDFILQAARKKTPVYNAYRRFCRLHRGQEIFYVDFEWKYYQFYHGESDLERSSLTLCELPIHVLEQVKEELPLVDCLSLRKVSKDLRRLVDSSDAHCETIEFNLYAYISLMKLDNLELKYEEKKGGKCIVTSDRMDTEKTKTYRDARNFKEVMFADASTFLSNPKLSIDRFQVNGINEMNREFVKFLKSIDHGLNVKALYGRDLKQLDSVQKFLKPETLEEIIYNQDDFYVLDFIKIAKKHSEILKNPKLKFEKIIFEFHSDADLAKFSEILQSLNSQVNIQSLVVDDVRWIPTIFQSVNPEKVETFIISYMADLTVDHFNAIAEREEWKTKTRLILWKIPEEMGLERLVDFKEILCEDGGVDRSHTYELSDENLIKIRDILLKSPHLDVLQLKKNATNIKKKNTRDKMNEVNERIKRIMIEDPAYDPSTRRFSIPNSQDYFQLESGIIESGIAGRHIELTIKRRVSPE